jgi:Ca2+-binding EF-hand superfamily protein
VWITPHRKNIRVVFRNFDLDKSGSVDYDELRKGLEHIGITLNDVDFQTLLDVVDNDKSGSIDYNEFIEDLKHVDEQQGGFFGEPGAQKAAVEARVAAAAPAPTFAASGRSGKSILSQVADKVEQKAKNVRVVFRNFDEDKSGSVDYGEFRRGLTHLGIALSDADFQALIDEVDNDKSGCIDCKYTAISTSASQSQLLFDRLFGSVCVDNEFVEDLKHADEQIGGYGHNSDSQQQQMKARQRPQPRQEMGGPVVNGSGVGGLGIQGISAVC